MASPNGVVPKPEFCDHVDPPFVVDHAITDVNDPTMHQLMNDMLAFIRPMLPVA